jgi:transglutaminase-like putative cysteine protease
VKLHVLSDLTYDFGAGSEIIVSIQAAASPDQSIRREKLNLEPKIKILQDKPDDRGERRFRAFAKGVTLIQYEAEIDVHRRKGVEPRQKKMRWIELPQDCLQYLTPSRYCTSDQFIDFAHREFGNVQPGGAQVLAIADWIYRNIAYRRASATLRPLPSTPWPRGPASAATFPTSASASAARSTCRRAPYPATRSI